MYLHAYNKINGKRLWFWKRIRRDKWKGLERGMGRETWCNYNLKKSLKKSTSEGKEEKHSLIYFMQLLWLPHWKQCSELQNNGGAIQLKETDETGMGESCISHCLIPGSLIWKYSILCTISKGTMETSMKSAEIITQWDEFSKKLITQCCINGTQEFSRTLQVDTQQPGIGNHSIVR